MTETNKRDRPAFQGPCIWRLHDVLKFTGLGRTQLFEGVRRGEIPAPIKLTPGGRSIGWDQLEMERWKEARKAARKRSA